MDLTALLILYKYPLLFVGTFFLGEMFFVPAAFLVKTGIFSFAGLMIIATAANIVSDIAWYFLVRFVPLEKMNKWSLIKNKREVINKVSIALDTYGYGLLFISKFLYGTRISVIIACSLKRFNLALYLIVSSLGTFAYLIVLYFLVTAIQTVHSITEYKLAALFIFLCLVVLYVWAQGLIRKRWLKED